METETNGGTKEDERKKLQGREEGWISRHACASETQRKIAVSSAFIHVYAGGSTESVKRLCRVLESALVLVEGRAALA